MKKLLIIALCSLPLVACVGAVDEGEGGDAYEETDVASTEQALRTPDYLVDFDQVFTNPIFPITSNPVASGSIADTLYSGYGVTFSCVTASRAFVSTSCTAGHVYARLSTGAGGNVVAPHPQLQSFDVRFGMVQATFGNLKEWVSIDATPIKNPEHLGSTLAAPWLAAYGADDKLIASVQHTALYPQAGWDQTQTLSINVGSAAIKYVRFSSSYYSNMTNIGGKFDNLRFNGDELRPIADLPPRPPILRPIF